MLGAAFGVSMSANLLIGQSIGAGDMPMVKRVIGTAVTFFLVLSIAVGVGATRSRPPSCAPWARRRTRSRTRSPICG
uniref:Uncharacterized protein n=1 Tax=Phenylobacterium glaciei TaxID=2803784 RepID=A0A974P427_9CAUL|nr:hypothetical protein JKL49_05835 [Phenylobacterium glaciei]